MNNPIEPQTLLAMSFINANMARLKTAAAGHLEQVIRQKDLISSALDDQFDLPKLTQKYQAKKSYIDWAADWYGQQYLATIVFLGVAVVGLGYLFQMSMVFSLLIYAMVTFLLHNHYHNAVEQEKLVLDDVAALKESLTGTIAHMDIIRRSLEQTLSSFSDLFNQAAQLNIALETKNAELTIEINRFKESVISLKDIIREITDTNTALKAELSSVCTQLRGHERSMSESAQSIRSSDQRLDQTCADIDANNLELAQLVSTYKTLITRYEGLCAEFEERHTMDDRVPREALDIDALIAHGQAICAEAARDADYVKRSKHNV